jgi:hypothetical protein
MKIGLIEHLDYPVKIWLPSPTENSPHPWAHNPTITRDPKGQVWIGIRHHDLLPLTVHLDPLNPNAQEPSRFKVGKFDPETLAVTDLKLIVPEEGSPLFLQVHNIEDVRIFWRHDGLHGIGVIFTSGGIVQGEILIDYDNGTYRLLHDYGQPHKHTEKNWSPPSQFTEAFDFIYSQTQTIKYGKPRGPEVYKGEIHGGSQLLPYKDGWISIAHRVSPIVALTWRWYLTVARLHDYRGKVTHISQFFDFGTGWRENLQESVEYVSGAIWTKDQEELLLSLGVRDETCGFVRVPVSAFKWQEPGGIYHKFELDESLQKIVENHAGQKPIQGFVL